MIKQKDIICIFLIFLLIYLVFTPVKEGLSINSIDGFAPNILERIPLFYR